MKTGDVSLMPTNPATIALILLTLVRTIHAADKSPNQILGGQASGIEWRMGKLLRRLRELRRSQQPERQQHKSVRWSRGFVRPGRCFGRDDSVL
jgi:hypothetical protein